MKVKELIEKLSKLDPCLRVAVGSREETGHVYNDDNLGDPIVIDGRVVICNDYFTRRDVEFYYSKINDV